MGTPWDRAAAGYVEQWVPRFVPYHLDLVREVTLRPGHRVLVASAGPGSEVLAAARAVGDGGAVRATDRDGVMVRIAAEQVRRAGFATAITCEEAEPINTAGGPWDAILCAFALPRLPDRLRVLTSWSQALDTRGKVAVSVWGPDEPGDPVDFLKKSLRQEAGSGMFTEPPFPTDRQAMARLFDEVGLELVRHTVVQHTISFRSTEEFASALVEGAGWNDAFARLDEEGRHRALVRFYDAMGGPDAPLVYRACATIAVACRPGADVEVEAVPSLRILPVAPDSNPSGGLL